jgi:hypothetical protein
MIVHFIWPIAIRFQLIRSAYCYTNIRPSVTRVDLAKKKLSNLQRILTTPPVNSFLQLSRDIGSPLSDAVIDAKFRGRHPPRPSPGKTRFAGYSFDRSAETAPASGKISAQLITNSTASFPMTPTLNLSRGFESPLQWKQNSKLAFFVKNAIQTSEVSCKFPIWANFLRHNFRAIVKHSYG